MGQPDRRVCPACPQPPLQANSRTCASKKAITDDIKSGAELGRKREKNKEKEKSLKTLELEMRTLGIPEIVRFR